MSRRTSPRRRIGPREARPTRASDLPGSQRAMSEPTREDKDKSGKWLIEQHGDAILRIGGVTDLVRWEAGPAEIVLPAKLPDGFVRAWRAGRDRPEPSVIELATYPEHAHGSAGARRPAAGLPPPPRGPQRPRARAAAQGPAPCRRSGPPPRLGWGDRGRGPVASHRAVEDAGRAGAGDGGPGPDAVGAADGCSRAARGRPAAVPRGYRRTCPGGRPRPPDHRHEGLHATAVYGPRFALDPGEEHRHEWHSSRHRPWHDLLRRDAIAATGQTFVLAVLRAHFGPCRPRWKPR